MMAPRPSPFKESDERREFEILIHNRRFNNNSLQRYEKSISTQMKRIDGEYNYMKKQLQAAEARRQSRIDDLKQERLVIADRCQSLPCIEEAISLSEDPYPVTFKSQVPLHLKGDECKYHGQRRKSKEFEDLPRLTFNLLSKDSPPLTPIARRRRDTPIHPQRTWLAAAPSSTENSPRTSPSLVRRTDKSHKIDVNVLPFHRHTEEVPMNLTNQNSLFLSEEMSQDRKTANSNFRATSASLAPSGKDQFVTSENDRIDAPIPEEEEGR